MPHAARLRSVLSGLAFLLLVAACGDVGDAPRAATGDALDVTTGEGRALAIDTSQSSIDWKAAKVTRAHDGGFNLYSGTVYVNAGSVTGVDVNIDARSIWSDSDRLTGHLQSPDFFDVETNPDAGFVADQIVPFDSAGFTHRVSGNLTFAGETNSVTFPATIDVAEDRVTAQADFVIDRQRWNLSYPGQPDDLIRDDVRILFDIVATASAGLPADEVAQDTTVAAPVR